MTNEEIKKMCISILRADTEENVIKILEDSGLWNNPKVWRCYGDNEMNYSTIGNQQSRADAALVEKVVNSVDAVLMNECWIHGMSPEDSSAPKNIHEAVASYFKGDGSKQESLGHIGNWSVKERTEVSRRITIASTGAKDNPCFTISDDGEGQTPSSMPITILSLDKKNKQRVGFVQGKYNMGGTGVLRFCGRRKLHFVLSRRNPNIKNDPADNTTTMWGFTVIRREDPMEGEKSSVYKYLAPIDADKRPLKGEILRFNAETMPIFPDGRNAYGRSSSWGTTIKLYEYEAMGFRTDMMRKGGLLSRFDILLPDIALPIRLHECRDYGGHAGSYETTSSGLNVRLKDDRKGNLEEGFPTTSPLVALGQRMTAKIYAFKKGKAETYRGSEGIIFTVNGQTQGHLTLTFFDRTVVGMNRLRDSILVIVDCSNISRRSCEDLFMNSRDRLTNCELRYAIEDELEDIVKNHQGLKDLRERRRREDVSSKLTDLKPLEEILKSILKSSPSLSSIFMTGTRLPDPFRTAEVVEIQEPFSGKPYPTYFKFQRLEYGRELERKAAINMRYRIKFETDVVNDYFDRLENKGHFNLSIISDAETKQVSTYSLNLQNGIATLSVKLPEDCVVGDKIKYEARAEDDTSVDAFVNLFIIEVGPAQEVSSGGGGRSGTPGKVSGNKREIPMGLAMPNINQIYENDWPKHSFDRYSALKVVQEEAIGNEGANTEGIGLYSFFVNMDNVYLNTEIKSSKEDPEILKARFMYGMVLFGMSLIKQHVDYGKENTTPDNEDPNIQNTNTSLQDTISKISVAVAPVILPMIKSLGALTTDQIAAGSHVGDNE